MECKYCSCTTEDGYVARTREGQYFWTVDPYAIFTGPAMDEDVILIVNDGNRLNAYLHNMRTDAKRCPCCERIYIEGGGSQGGRIAEFMPQKKLREVK